MAQDKRPIEEGVEYFENSYVIAHRVEDWIHEAPVEDAGPLPKTPRTIEEISLDLEAEARGWVHRHYGDEPAIGPVPPPDNSSPQTVLRAIGALGAGALAVFTFLVAPILVLSAIPGALLIWFAGGKRVSPEEQQRRHRSNHQYMLSQWKKDREHLVQELYASARTIFFEAIPTELGIPKRLHQNFAAWLRVNPKSRYEAIRSDVGMWQQQPEFPDPPVRTSRGCFAPRIRGLLLPNAS